MLRLEELYSYTEKTQQKRHGKKTKTEENYDSVCMFLLY